MFSYLMGRRSEKSEDRFFWICPRYVQFLQKWFSRFVTFTLISQKIQFRYLHIFNLKCFCRMQIFTTLDHCFLFIFWSAVCLLFADPLEFIEAIKGYVTTRHGKYAMVDQRGYSYLHHRF